VTNCWGVPPGGARQHGRTAHKVIRDWGRVRHESPPRTSSISPRSTGQRVLSGTRIPDESCLLSDRVDQRLAPLAARAGDHEAVLAGERRDEAAHNLPRSARLGDDLVQHCAAGACSSSRSLELDLGASAPGAGTGRPSFSRRQNIGESSFIDVTQQTGLADKNLNRDFRVVFHDSNHAYRVVRLKGPFSRRRSSVGTS
jgi:hypothetical protein